MGKEPIRYEDGRPVYEDQIEPGYTKFTWQHQLWDSTDDRIRASTIAVAAVLVDHANSATCVAWPSLETIARCSHLSVRTVQRILSDLEEMGWINYLRRGGGMRGRRSIHDQPRGFSNTYQLILPDKVDIGNRGLDIEGPNMDIEGKGVVNGDRRVDISDSNVDTHVQQTIKEERGTHKGNPIKQEVCSNVSEDGIPSSKGDGNVLPRVRSLAEVFDEACLNQEPSVVFMELLRSYRPDLIHHGDIRAKVEKEIGDLDLGQRSALGIAYALDSLLAFYENNPRARQLKPGGIYNAFKDVPHPYMDEKDPYQ
jgi:AraC-like DNA-binding protein